MSVKHVLTALAAAVVMVSCGKKQEPQVQTEPVK